MNWTYDKAGEAWLSGKNSVVDGEILLIGPFNSLEEAQRASETEYDIIRERSDHENGNFQ